jgi:hypothetical protein
LIAPSRSYPAILSTPCALDRQFATILIASRGAIGKFG